MCLEPERAPEAPLLIVATVSEQVAYVYRNGICIARSIVSTGRPCIGKSKSSESIFSTAQESGLPAGFVDKLKAVIAPGTALFFSDRPVDPTTWSPANFQILDAQKDKPAKT
jgi:hypothetical protein